MQVAQAVRRRRAPDGMQHRMQQSAALRRGKCGLRRLPALRPKTYAGERLESALRLKRKNSRAAVRLSRKKGNRARVFEIHRERGPNGSRRKAGGHRLRRAGKWQHQARSARFSIVYLPGKAETNLRRGSKKARGDGAGQLPVKLRRGMGHAELPLHLDRNYWMS